MKIDGKERFLKRIAAIPQAARDEMRKALKASAEEMTAAAKLLAPVDSGALKASISYTFGEYRPDNANVRGVNAGGGGHDLAVTIHAGDAKAWYASLVEFGTNPHVIKAKRPGGLLNVNGRMVERVSHPGSVATPFFFPAYRLTIKRHRARLGRAMRAAIKKEVSG